MKTFRVFAKDVRILYEDFKAKDEQEALQKGEDLAIQGGFYKESEASYFEVFEAEVLQ